MAAVHRFARFTEKAKFLSKCYFISQNGTLGSFCTMVQQPQKMQSSLVKFALIGAETGTEVGAGYAYQDQGDIGRTSPWRERNWRLHWRLQVQAACHSVPEDYVPSGFYQFETYVIPVRHALFAVRSENSWIIMGYLTTL